MIYLNRVEFYLVLIKPIQVKNQEYIIKILLLQNKIFVKLSLTLIVEDLY